MRHLSFLLLLFIYGTVANAQVLVSEEPRHKPVFQNESIRILNVLLPPGDTTQYHRHALPSVFLCLTKTTTAGQLLGKDPVQSSSAIGYMWFENLAPPHSKVHRVWNVDTNTFHVMDIELLSKDSGFTEKPLLLPHLQIAIDTPWARSYTLALEKGTDFVVTSNRKLLAVAILDATVQLQKGSATEIQTAQPGAYFWISAGQKFVLKNIANTIARFALIEVH